MRVAIDARLAAYRGGGIAEHIARLAEGLASVLAEREPKGAVGVTLLEHRRSTRPSLARGPLGAVRCATPPHHRFEGWALPLEIALRRAGTRPDVLHSPDFIVPWAWRGPAVATVHDLAFLENPDLLTRESRRYYGGVHRSVVRAERTIAVSRYTRERLLALTEIDPARVREVPNALAGRYLDLAASGGAPRGAAIAAVLARHGLDTGYLLHVGTIEPRKNLAFLLEVLRAMLDAGRDARLVLAGAEGWRSEPFHRHLVDLGLADRTRLLGAVPESDLPAIYAAAALLVHPALDEGFGFTPLEAMACGTPAVVASAGALPEVTGTAALHLPLGDARTWAAAIGALLDDAPRRTAMSSAGRERALGFTPERMAHATLEVYAEAAADGRSAAAGSHHGG